MKLSNKRSTDVWIKKEKLSVEIILCNSNLEKGMKNTFKGESIMLLSEHVMMDNQAK